MHNICAVYLLTNKNNTVIYTGVTSNLVKRLSQHSNCDYPNSLTAKYNIHKLMYFEEFNTIGNAI